MGIFKDKLNLEALKRFYRETDNSYVRKLLDGLIVKLTQLDIGEEEIGWSFRLHEVGKVISYAKGQVYGVERTFREDLRPENEVVFIYPEKFHSCISGFPGSLSSKYSNLCKLRDSCAYRKSNICLLL
eukprot:GHVP01017646.1.p1 GENE.GHVP01017646.1~~GHVP01017646.1.p1  ORF type:complete len:144 (-),score=20.55 GHVP01017646.1:224-607(-)